MSGTSKTDEEKIEEIIKELNVRKFDYNRTELTNIRNRTHQILGFCLIITSIIIGILSGSTSEKILGSFTLSLVMIIGFTILIIVMTKCYLIMIRRIEDPLIDPEATFQTFTSGNFNEVYKEFRESIFREHKKIDKRNYGLKTEMWEIYQEVPLSFVIIFIPIIIAYWL